MKRLVHHDMDIMCMAKLMSEYADKSITGEFGKFIYFSQAQHAVGPRIKFFGGGNNLSTQGAPSLEFNFHGIGKIIGDVKQFPNIQNKKYMKNVYDFVDRFRPLLLLTWYNHLDEGLLQKYFEGSISWKRLMQSTNVPELVKCPNQDLETLHELCLKYNLYNFPSRR